MRDLEIRKALHAMAEQLHDPNDTLVVDELGLCLGSVRVDVAVVNGVMHGYEIKSDADTLARLPAQCAAYSRVLDYATVVCGAKRVTDVRRIVPKWWGIIVADKVCRDVHLAVVQEEQRNPSIDAYAQAQLLWRDEALAALETRGLDTGIRSKPRRALWRRLADSIPQEVGHIVRETIKGRQNWRVVAQQT